MNVLFYIPELSQANGGTRQYAVGLLKLLSRDTQTDYFIYHNSGDVEVLNIIADNPRLKRIQDGDVNIKRKSYFQKKMRGVERRLRRRFKFGQERPEPTFIDTLCRQFHIDILHCPYQFIPYTSEARLITTLHDVQEIHFPEFFTAEERAYRANAYLDFIRRSHIVIVSFQHVKTDLIKYFDVANDKIEILLLKMDELWFNRFSESDILDITPLNLPKQFLLYPANTWKHKNHLRLIEAVQVAKERNNVILNVVCTGHKNEHFAEIDLLLGNMNLRDQVIFTDVVDEKILYTLYKTCKGVVIPTTYEAGSFPLYESILLGVPVVCSNVTSLPETIGNNDFLFDPFDIESIAKKMLSLWLDSDFREKNRLHLNLQAKSIREHDSLSVLTKLYSLL